MMKSIANSSDILLGSRSTAPKTTSSITTEADGMVGMAIDNAVDVMRIMSNESSPRVTPFNWAMKQADIDIYNAVPERKKKNMQYRLSEQIL